MPIIDSQVHCYERNHAGRPWAGVLHGPPEVTGDQMVKAMDEVGVDGALLVSPYAMYRFDGSYALEVYAKHPSRFGLIKPFDPNDPAVAEQIADWKSKTGTVGVRIMFNDSVSKDPADPGINRIMAAAAKHGFPVNCLAWGRLDQLKDVAKRNPNTQVVLDHIGLQQPFEPPAPKEPFKDAAKVIELAQVKNLAIKISGACTLAHKPYPYDDIWEPLLKIIDAYDLERCLWGTDWTRATGLITYKQGVEPFKKTQHLSESDREMLMGGTLAEIYKWAPKTA